MRRILKYFVVAILVIGGYVGYQSMQTSKEFVAAAPAMNSFLRGVSGNWSSLSLRSHLREKEYREDADSYRKLLDQYRPIGIYKGCEKMKRVSTDQPGYQDAFGVTGLCTFSNGQAILTMFLMPEGEGYKVVYFRLSSS